MNAVLQNGRPSDVPVQGAQVHFRDVALEPPFVISGRPLTHITAVTVQVEVTDRAGLVSGGVGAGMLSVPWSWPSAGLSLEARERVMRELVQLLAARAAGSSLCGDPFVLWRSLYDGPRVSFS